MSDESTIRVMQLPARGQITIPSEFRRRLGLTDGSLLQMRLVGDKIEIRSLRVADSSLRQYTESEIQQFLEDDRIDEATAAAVRRLLAEGEL
jgi:AbrB family looped-hinge helix DNA binding protein